ncbi:MAG: DegT/DnrJ/EryC1/StrS family aminotransferase [Sulfurospirillaceae bacterium]|nr:DegT/DnrJ/EryC1/StrS family aminotransferase [Sulfurospirillaceae bacterium]
MTPFDLQIANKPTFIPELFEKSDLYFYPYARYAFLEVLKKLSLKSIYLPAFICRDILAPINTLGIKYTFYDVDERLCPILEDISCEAILMVNYFGFAQDIAPFVAYKQKCGALIIEDNAHGFLSKDKKGEWLGSRGDIGLLSIRKTVFLPNGGALLINNEALKNRGYESASSEESFEDSAYLKKLNIKKKIFSHYMGIGIVLMRRIMRYLKTGSMLPLPDKDSEHNMPSNCYLTPVLKDKSILLDIQKESDRRRKLYEMIQTWAKEFRIEAIYELDAFGVPFEFAFIDNAKSKAFERFLFKKGFFILPWPDLPDEVIAGQCREFYKHVKVVPFLW